MKIISSITNLYLTGHINPSKSFLSEPKPTDFTREELDDLETTEEDLLQAQTQGNHFKNPTLNLSADFNYVHGQFRSCGVSVVNSFFSGLGSFISEKINFIQGLALASLAIGISFFKKIPFINKKYNFLSLGSNTFLRGPLHVLDSIFSKIGEEGAKYKYPSLFAGALSLFSLTRVLNKKENKSLKAEIDTISGTLSRTAIHHMDSMLASQASSISSQLPEVGSFLGTALTSAGLSLPDKIKKQDLPWDNLEGFLSQGSSHFIDSLFSNIGNAFSSFSAESKNIFLGGAGLLTSIPLFSKLTNKWNYKIPFGTIEGRLIRSIFHVPEAFLFNMGSLVGSSGIGIPLSLGFAGLTFLGVKNKIFETSISRDSIKGLYQRLPFDFIYSMISASGARIAEIVPAPLALVLGPSISFRLGELFKGIPSKFDNLKGLMLRNSIHLWESILSKSAFKFGKSLLGDAAENQSSGSILSDGRWINSEGRILPTMAAGKQANECSEKNLTSILVSSLIGICSGYGLSKLISKFKFNSREGRQSFEYEGKHNIKGAQQTQDTNKHQLDLVLA